MSGGSDVDPYYERALKRKRNAESKKTSTKKDQSASGLDAQSRGVRRIDERLKSPEKHIDEAQPSEKEISKIAKNYIASSHWKDTRLKIMERDGYKCQSCARGLDDVIRHRVHHIYPLKEYIRDGFDPETYPEQMLATVCDSCHTYSERRPGLLKIPQKYPMADYSRLDSRHKSASHCSETLRRLQDAGDKILSSRGIEILRRHNTPSNPPNLLPKSADQESINRMNDSMKEFMLKLFKEVRKERQRVREFRKNGRVRNPNKQLSPMESSGIPEDWRFPFAKFDEVIRDELFELEFELYGLEVTLKERDELKDSSSGDN
jgi:hypothetical protein